MKPNKLIIQAFGPFSGTESVDFNLLGANPLFLINGPTGAGKSSILDAICFALYGQTTGNERDAAQMRCDYADNSLLTEVVLEFSLGDSRYRIRRSPTQERPKARGEGTTTQQVSAQLWQVKSDGDVLLVPKSALEATRLVEDITGLNVEQFRQVMVLPQGKFREFLMADSHQREAIFSKLFQTQIYKRLENSLKERAANIRKGVDNLQHEIKGLLRGVDLTVESEVQEQLTALLPQLALSEQCKISKSKAQAAADKLFVEAKSLMSAFDSMAKSQQALDTLNADQAVISEKRAILSRAQLAQKIKHLRDALSKVIDDQKRANKEIDLLEKQHAEKEQNVTLAEKAFMSAEKESHIVEGLKARIITLNELSPKIKQLGVALDYSKKTKSESVLADAGFTKANAEMNACVERIKKAQSRDSELKKALLPLSDQKTRLDKLQLLGQQRAKLDDLINEKESLEKEHGTRQLRCDAIKVSIEDQAIQIKTLELSWHSNQAVLLSAELKEGKPCLVCGSLTHPLPAMIDESDKPVVKQDIDDARKRHDQLHKDQTFCQKQITETETQLCALDKSLLALITELGAHQSKSTDEFRDDWMRLNNEVKRLSAMQDEQVRLDETLQSLMVAREALIAQLEQSRATQQSAKQAFLSAQQEEEYLKKALPDEYRKPGELDKAIVTLDAQIKAITRRYEKARDLVSSEKQQATEIGARLKEKSNHYQTTLLALNNAESSWNNALNASDFDDEAAFLLALLPEIDQQNLSEEIQVYSDKLSGCKATLAQQKTQLAGKQPPDIDMLKVRCEETALASEQALNEWRAIDDRYQQLIRVQKKLNAAHQVNKSLEDEYKIYGTLSDVANGQTGNKISLQRFVLSVLLDDVLIEASQRLNIMSKGRYQLFRKEQRAKGNKASGLELEVEDAYTGKNRSVATLSGGESFMAALSLALGLSDVVQAYAGGIRLETLFIDEGFGSLDQESLDLAIRTLMDLQSTGRTIGIISHVSELREQMMLRLDVTTSTAGSEIRVAC